MTKLRFTKMHGLGNDFVVLDRISQQFELNADLIGQLANRHFGIGCDQVLVVEAPRLNGTDFHYRIFNADGSEVEQCGNGARCFARYVIEQGLTEKTIIPVGTAKGRIVLYQAENDQIRVDMGVPELKPERIPFRAEQQAKRYQIDIDGEQISGSAVSMGNPHFVHIVDDIGTGRVTELGPKIETAEEFPNRVNAGFMQIKSRNQIALRVWERGVGETLACGTGACAAVVAGRQLGLLDEAVEVALPGGELQVNWAGEGQPVWLTGPATRVFDGEIKLGKNSD